MDHLAFNADYRVAPGMAVACAIRRGTRSVRECLLTPVHDAVRDAAQER